MKILVIPSWHPTPEKPLWCTWVLPHISALKEAGHDVYVLQVDMEAPLDGSDKIIHLNEKHLYAPLAVNKHKIYRTRFFFGKTLNRYAQKLKELYQIVEKEWGKPDMIHAHVSLPGGYGAAELGVQKGIPVVVTEHYSGFENDAKYWWRVGYYVRKMGQKIQGFYAVSPGFAERIRRTGLVTVTGVLSNPIDTELFNCQENKNISRTFDIVTAANLSKLKGIDILFAALQSLIGTIDWHLTLFGNADKKQEYSKWLDNPEFSKRVSFPGKVSQNNLVKAYCQSDLYIVSSRIETANVSMLEAMACGCLVLTTEIGAPETMIDDRVGISIPSEEPKAMAEAIMKISKEITNYKREDLREFVVRNYSKKVAVDKMIEAYYEAIHLHNGLNYANQ